MYDELIEELRLHHCDAKEDDTQEICEECAYDVIIADKSVPSGIASVCVCGLMNRAADAIENLDDICQHQAYEIMELKNQWIPVTEQLPEEHSIVLLYSYGDVVVGTYDSEYKEFRELNGFHRLCTHWMPRPVPPKEET